MDRLESALSSVGRGEKVSASKVDTAASEACGLAKSRARDVARAIVRSISKVSVDKRLSLLYVLDAAVKKEAKKGRDGLAKCLQGQDMLERCLPSLAKVNDKSKLQVGKVLSRWFEKKIFKAALVKKWLDLTGCVVGDEIATAAQLEPLEQPGTADSAGQGRKRKSRWASDNTGPNKQPTIDNEALHEMLRSAQQTIEQQAGMGTNEPSLTVAAPPTLTMTHQSRSSITPTNLAKKSLTQSSDNKTASDGNNNGALPSKPSGTGSTSTAGGWGMFAVNAAGSSNAPNPPGPPAGHSDDRKVPAMGPQGSVPRPPFDRPPPRGWRDRGPAGSQNPYRRGSQGSEWRGRGPPRGEGGPWNPRGPPRGPPRGEAGAWNNPRGPPRGERGAWNNPRGPPRGEPGSWNNPRGPPRAPPRGEPGAWNNPRGPPRGAQGRERGAWNPPGRGPPRGEGSWNNQRGGPPPANWNNHADGRSEGHNRQAGRGASEHAGPNHSDKNEEGAPGGWGNQQPSDGGAPNRWNGRQGSNSPGQGGAPRTWGEHGEPKTNAPGGAPWKENPRPAEPRREWSSSSVPLDNGPQRSEPPRSWDPAPPRETQASARSRGWADIGSTQPAGSGENSWQSNGTGDISKKNGSAGGWGSFASKEASGDT